MRYEELERGRIRNTARLLKARKLIKLALESGHLIDRPQDDDANAKACAYAANQLLRLAIQTQCREVK